VTLMPIATFLAGSLLSLLLPVLLLIALVVWYWMFIRRVPDPADGADAGSAGAAPGSPPSAPPEADPPSSER
jgi:hypothetical protein